MRVISKTRIRLRGGIVLERGPNVVAEPVSAEVQRALEKLRKGRVLTFATDTADAQDEVVFREDTTPIDIPTVEPELAKQGTIESYRVEARVHVDSSQKVTASDPVDVTHRRSKKR